MQIEINRELDLLDDRGQISQPGWARQAFWRYDRSAIRANCLRIKEWDYYSLLSHDGRFGLTLTMSDLGYAGLFALCFLDFGRGFYHQVDTLCVLPCGRTGFPADADNGRIAYADKKLRLLFEYENGRRLLRFSAPGMSNGSGDRGLEGEVILTQPAGLESMNIATSWAENRRAFYYNRKINCLPAAGGFSIGPSQYHFDATKDFGALDWGRGFWTYKNRWYWGSASGYVGGKPFGFNIGYGFSDRSPASENALILDGRIHKLGDIEFRFDERNYYKTWHFVDTEGRFKLDFAPLVDRTADTNLGIIRSRQHQVFGEFSGTVVLDDRTALRLDRFLGFAEDVYNRW